MHINELINDIYQLLEQAMSYEDWDMVEEAHEELSLLIRDMNSNFPIDSDDY